MASRRPPPPEKGNQRAVKWATPEARAVLCAAVCKHLSEGFSMESFPDADPQTVRHYCGKYPTEFAPVKVALREGRKKLEMLGLSAAEGKVKNFQAVPWIFTMKNRGFGQDSHRDGPPPLHWIEALPDPDAPEDINAGHAQRDRTFNFTATSTKDREPPEAVKAALDGMEKGDKGGS